jgi:excisionase family DNA binding protein
MLAYSIWRKDMHKLLNIYQTSDLLGLKVKTLYTYVCKRKIPFVKLGSRVLFDPIKLEDWVKNKSVDSITTIG